MNEIIEDPPYGQYVWACSIGLLESLPDFILYILTPYQKLGIR